MKPNVYSISLVGLLCVSCSLLETPKSETLTEATPEREIAAVRTNPDGTLQALRKRVLVLPFSNQSGVGAADLAKYASDEMKSRISKLDEFILVSENEIQGFEQLYSVTGEPNFPEINKKARDHGIVAVILGTVKDVAIQERGNNVGIFKTRYNTVKADVQVKIYDVLTQKVTLDKNSLSEVTEESTVVLGNRSPASTESSRAEGAVSQAIDQMIPSFLSEAKRIGWTGRIAKIDMHRYYINAGELSGVTRNQLLRVFGGAEPVVDTESGLVIGMAPGRFKGFLKVVDFFGEDGAIAIVHSGAGFQEKDRVEAYLPPAP